MFLPEKAVSRATKALEPIRENLMSQPAVLGVGVGASDGNFTESAIVVYLDETAVTKPKLPAQIDGVGVRVILTGPL